ncbi:trypsin-like peptidase domain-containing protein [Actinoplanes oblitus]|uniref:Trypsin-like peptidase domain-containing protein n=1 Tax=Actinoplanes oblitus TaxID=3040509 RepID=A0ABY8WBR2_9ACTN|nr:AAA family ATPase [Actinoplanes oblitus]WIM94787.1 trypsin-like peptidase domain-containing protein [Actinoplanes oblitus]
MTGTVPPDDSWTLAVHASERDGAAGFAPLGTAVAIDTRRALTCAHVVPDGEIWVSFPKTLLWDVRHRVSRVEWHPGDRTIADVAVLHFDQDLPVEVEPARLRAPEPKDLQGLRWWAFGFPVSSRLHGNDAEGAIGTVLSHGCVRLDTDSAYPVEEGFSGSGLWVPEYAAVVGIVGRARSGAARIRPGDAQALTLAQADRFVPAEKLTMLVGWRVADAGPVALSSWGWKLGDDPDTARHFDSRARGVTTVAERGHRFRGRVVALRAITGWLGRPAPDRRVLVVTGSPGVGKSAVLGRIVTTADADLRRRLPSDDTGVRAEAGSVACAVHAKGKTALEVAAEIATAASAALPARPDALAESMAERLEARPGRFNVVIDALDEADTADEARSILSKVVLPLVQACAGRGVQVVVGTRRHDSRGDLLDGLAGMTELIDLDDARYFQLADLRDYTLATLRMDGDPRPDNPYDEPANAAAAAAVADRIARLASGNFLVAGLEARRHGMYATRPADPGAVSLTPTVHAALHTFLSVLPPVDGVAAVLVLTALAYAESPGWTVSLWQAAAGALGGRIGTAELAGFARSAAANFLVETSVDGNEPVFRLFHQALNDALRKPREVRADERALTEVFLETGRRSGWAAAPAYLLRSLPGHAARAELVDDLLADDDYLLHADLVRLIPAAAEARTEAGHDRARLLRLTPQAIGASPPERAAMLGVTQALQGDPVTISHPRMPYRALWGRAAPRIEHATLEGHTDWIRALCVVEAEGRTLLASGGDDDTIRVWDPVSGATHAVLETGEFVYGLCQVRFGGQTLIAAATTAGAVQLWNPGAGVAPVRLEGHAAALNAVCEVPTPDRVLLASASDDGTIRLWDPATAGTHAVLRGHTGAVNAVCALATAEGTLLASAGDDGTVRLWDPVTGAARAVLDGHEEGAIAVCAVREDGRTLLASGGEEGSVRLWDPIAGTPGAVLAGHVRRVMALCQVPARDGSLLVSGGADNTIRLWDLSTNLARAELPGHTDWVRVVCPVRAGGRTLLASASDDWTVRLWDPEPGAVQAALRGRAVTGVCAVRAGDRTVVAASDAELTLHLWDAATGDALVVPDQGEWLVNEVCALAVDDEVLLCTAEDPAVRLWDPLRGRTVHLLEEDFERAVVMCGIRLDGRPMLAYGTGSTIRLWDVTTGRTHAVLPMRDIDVVRAMCGMPVGDRMALALAMRDGGLRLWYPATGSVQTVVTESGEVVSALCVVPILGRSLLAYAEGTGLIRLWDPVTESVHASLEGHNGWVETLCGVPAGDRTLLVSGGGDRTVRIWDLDTRHPTDIAIHFPVHCCAAVGRGVAVGTSGGLLMIEPAADHA